MTLDTEDVIAEDAAKGMIELLKETLVVKVVGDVAWAGSLLVMAVSPPSAFEAEAALAAAADKAATWDDAHGGILLELEEGGGDGDGGGGCFCRANMFD